VVRRSRSPGSKILEFQRTVLTLTTALSRTLRSSAPNCLVIIPLPKHLEHRLALKSNEVLESIESINVSHALAVSIFPCTALIFL
jgi:hypothetical protein